MIWLIEADKSIRIPMAVCGTVSPPVPLSHINLIAPISFIQGSPSFISIKWTLQENIDDNRCQLYGHTKTSFSHSFPPLPPLGIRVLSLIIIPKWKQEYFVRCVTLKRASPRSARYGLWWEVDYLIFHKAVPSFDCWNGFFYRQWQPGQDRHKRMLTIVFND